MNLPPHDLAEHPADELLSAHLDDAVEGDERNALEEHLAACDRCTERLAALGSHPAALAVEPLDAVARRRLVSQALEAADAAAVASRRTAAWWRSPRLAAAAVIALLTTIGVATALSGGGNDRDAATSVAGGIPQSAFVGDVGRLDDPRVLRGFVREQEFAGGGSLGGGLTSGGAGTGGADADAGSEDDDAGGDAATGGSESVQQPASDGAPQEEAAPSAAVPDRLARAPDPEARADAERCLAVLQDAIPEGARVALAASGTFQDTPAVALVLDSGEGRYLAFVVAREDCTILTFQSFAG